MPLRDLDTMFNPHSIAIVGASRDQKKIGNIVLKNILASGYKHDIFLVNPNATTILGIKTYASIDLLPQKPDLAILAIPANLVLPTLEQIGKMGIKNCIVLAAGFKEIGKEGVILENKAVEIINHYKINMLGPNCMGFLNANAHLNATFGAVTEKAGSLHFISQSGAIASSLFDFAQNNNFGFSNFVTLGNKSDITENDVLEYWLKDKLFNTTHAPIGMYLESISDGKKFLSLLSKIIVDHPVFMLKPGKSAGAKKAMQSHTGAIAGESKITEAALKQYGVIICDTLETLFDLSKAFTWSKIPQGPNVAIISNAGGPAVISTDALETTDLKLASLSTKTQDILMSKLPRSASIINPVDILGDAITQRYQDALEAVLEEKSADTILVILTPQVMTEINKTAQLLSSFKSKTNKPIVCAFIGGTQTQIGIDILCEHEIAAFNFPERAINAIAKMWKWQQFAQQQNTVTSLINTSEIDKLNFSKIANLLENKQDFYSDINLLGYLGILTPKTVVLDKNKEFAQISLDNLAPEIKYPIVLKAASPNIMHKTEKHAVITNIKSDQELLNSKKQLDMLADNKMRFVIQEQILGVELIIGIKKDINFGNAVLFGAGGIYAELFSNSEILILPTNDDVIRQMILKSPVFPMLNGYRNTPKVDVEEIVSVIQKLETLCEMYPQINEIEINPLIANSEGVWAVDARIIL